MTVLHCYTSTYNDLYMIRHYVRHWSRYASKIFVYDDDSTDGTREFLDNCAPLVEIHHPGFDGIDELKLQELRSNEYRKHSRGVADWVVIGDSDELHYHPNMLEALAEKKRQDYCAIVSHGWQMIADTRPPEDGYLTDHVKQGIEDSLYNRVIFDPGLDVQWGIGHHGFAIENGPILRFSRRHPIRTVENNGPYRIECSEAEFKMLHYKYLGREYVMNRHARVWSRLSERNKMQGWGHHNAPDYHGTHSADWAETKREQRKRVID